MSDDIIIGMADLPASADDCGCCHGVSATLPAARSNPPGQPAIGYRVGTHASFKATLLARLSSPEFPALARLRTRADDDFAIALIDGFATMADVLTFYQERIANEAYLATANESLSVTELTRLIGYRRRPGVAASVDLAFTLEPAPGAPEMAVSTTTIASATRVQSIPGPGERAQTFETVETIEGRVAWNALKPQQSVRHRLRKGDRIVYLKGAAVALKAGDTLVLVGPEREGHPGDFHWDFRRVSQVAIDAASDRTIVTLDYAFGTWIPDNPPVADPTLYVLRQRAALFAANAIHPGALHPDVLSSGFPNQAATSDWPYAFTGATIHLDTTYPGIVPKSWLVLARPNFREIYQVNSVAETGRSQFLVSGKTTELGLDTSFNLNQFDDTAYRATAVYAQSEALELATAPILAPVSGDAITLEGLVADLARGRRLIVRGKRPLVRVKDLPLTLADPDAPGQTFEMRAGEVLTVTAPPLALPGGVLLRWRLRTAGGREGTIDLIIGGAPLNFIPAGKDDPLIAETAILDAVELDDEKIHSRLRLKEALKQAYDRGSAEVLANVARATHGESVSDILGSGDAGMRWQRFALRQAPLTHVRVPTGGGSESTLTLRVNDVLWREVPYLYGRGAGERVYATRLADDGTSVVEFGDGATGARPPTGQDNIVAAYRKGIGLDGLVKAGQVSLLGARPLGVKSVVNPRPSEGAQDPESAGQARRNAPTSVLTLGRAVSLKDYEDYARTFAGIAKARATLIWDGQVRRIFLTVAGPGGACLEANGETATSLLAALRSDGDPYAAVDVGSHRAVGVRLRVRVKVDPDRRPEAVLAAVAERLQAAFGFDAREFAQFLSLGEVIAAASAVAGVTAVSVDRLYRTIAPDNTPERNTRLIAAPAERQPDGSVFGAELLTLAPDPFDGLEVLP
jgi:hypothetical protein